MAEIYRFYLTLDEITRQAKKFFGNARDWELARDEPTSLRFKGEHGFVQLDIQSDTNNESRVVFAHDGYPDQVQAFRRQLSKMSTAETRIGS